jgi:hypothetical protein
MAVEQSQRWRGCYFIAWLGLTIRQCIGRWCVLRTVHGYILEVWDVDGTSFLFLTRLLKSVNRGDGSCSGLSCVAERYRQCTIPNDHGFHIILRGQSCQRAIQRVLQFIAGLELREPAVHLSVLHQQVPIVRDDMRRYLAGAAPHYVGHGDLSWQKMDANVLHVALIVLWIPGARLPIELRVGNRSDNRRAPYWNSADLVDLRGETGTQALIQRSMYGWPHDSRPPTGHHHDEQHRRDCQRDEGASQTTSAFGLWLAASDSAKWRRPAQWRGGNG